MADIAALQLRLQTFGFPQSEFCLLGKIVSLLPPDEFEVFGRYLIGYDGRVFNGSRFSGECFAGVFEDEPDFCRLLAEHFLDQDIEELSVFARYCRHRFSMQR